MSRICNDTETNIPFECGDVFTLLPINFGRTLGWKCKRKRKPILIDDNDNDSLLGQTSTSDTTIYVFKLSGMSEDFRKRFSFDDINMNKKFSLLWSEQIVDLITKEEVQYECKDDFCHFPLTIEGIVQVKSICRF